VGGERDRAAEPEPRGKLVEAVAVGEVLRPGMGIADDQGASVGEAGADRGQGRDQHVLAAVLGDVPQRDEAALAGRDPEAFAISLAVAARVVGDRRVQHRHASSASARILGRDGTRAGEHRVGERSGHRRQCSAADDPGGGRRAAGSGSVAPASREELAGVDDRGDALAPRGDQRRREQGARHDD